MTPEMIELARHALGLPNRTRKSYRNYFTCGPGHRDYANWNTMVDQGYATCRRRSKLYAGDDIFWLTFKGARTALRPRETLDLEDFPA